MVRRDIVANFLGRSWAMLMGIAFVPVYLAILGPEAYGLIGFYATLQAVLIIADFGLSWTITRELSRAPASGAGKHQLASLLRTLEIAYWLIAILAGAAVSIIGGALSERWFRSNTLSTDEIRQTLQLMGVVLALQMPSLFYQGALNGFDRQPTTNLIASLSAMLRWGGCGTGRLARVADGPRVFCLAGRGRCGRHRHHGMGGLAQCGRRVPAGKFRPSCTAAGMAFHLRDTGQCSRRRPRHAGR